MWLGLVEQAHKQVVILENRLEQAYHKYNSARAANAQLRTGVDALRKERLVFEEAHRKAQAALVMQKRDMIGLIRSIHGAHEQRERVCET